MYNEALSLSFGINASIHLNVKLKNSFSFLKLSQSAFFKLYGGSITAKFTKLSSIFSKNLKQSIA